MSSCIFLVIHHGAQGHVIFFRNFEATDLKIDGLLTKVVFNRGLTVDGKLKFSYGLPIDP